MNGEYHIGCSGYYYSYWKNRFYPQGVQPKDWLKYYSSIFNTVELNGTFYRVPKLSDLKKYAAVTPADFKFSVKMTKYISHVAKLQNSKQEISDFQGLITEGLGDKLNCFLFQMPPSFQFNLENLERIVANLPQEQKNVVELRHPSWWNEDVAEAFREARLTFCNVDFPKMETYFIQTTDIFYLRLHGNPNLFKSSYSPERIKKFYEQFPENCREYNIYFNNTYYEAGYQNASDLINIVKNNV